jgi:hypothetical protein
MAALEITLSYTGRDADRSEIDLYDVGQALIGFQRSLALTTHLILNNEIITQSPSLDGAQILAHPSRRGSWELTALIAITPVALHALYRLGTAPKDTPIGHLIRSAYDYVISETLGFHVDYDKTLGVQYEELTRQGVTKLPQTRFDSLIEKCEVAIREMHRPISKSETATKGRLITKVDANTAPLRHPLTIKTYEHIAFTERSPETTDFVGRISSYNINTFKGRAYIGREGRPVPFELSENARDDASVATITGSLSLNARDRKDEAADIEFVAFENRSRSGRLKSLYVTQISDDSA